MTKSTSLWCEDCRFVCFERGLGKPMLILNDPNGFKNTTEVYSIYLELRMALPYQIMQHRKVKICQPMSGFSRYIRSTHDVRKTANATRMNVRTYIKCHPQPGKSDSQSGRRYWKHYWTSHRGFLLWLVGFCALVARLPFPSRSYELNSFQDQGMPTVACNNPPGHTFESP